MNSAWQIEYAINARKFLKKVDKAVSTRILQWLNDRILANNADPYSLGTKLKGDKLGDLWRYRVGDYRILCKIYDHKLLILVVEIGHRKDVYKK